jgi:hypothetical protein
VSHATGYTPFYLNHGRQCSSPDTEYLNTKIKSLDAHASSLATALKMAWDTIAGSVWRSKTDQLNRRTVQPLEFKHYEVDQLCFIKRIPRKFYRDIKDEEDYKISAKLLARYAGPYRIIEKKSEVVYIAMVHGQRRAIHAINMKPAMVDLHVAVAQPDPALAAAELAEDLQHEVNADALLLRALRGVELNPPRPPQPIIETVPSAPRIMRKLSPVTRPPAPQAEQRAAEPAQQPQPEQQQQQQQDAMQQLLQAATAAAHEDWLAPDHEEEDAAEEDAAAALTALHDME